MGKINILSKNVAELIAAGEVVERPASIVKELVENSIDSGAKNIIIEIRDGGTSLIRVIDDGCGILREDVSKAFLRHATSKVKDENDLQSISTLGFRGEALASICAVSKVEIITRTEDEIAGTHYSILGGNEGQVDDIGCACGTTIIVKDVFYNIPARMKFLKSNASEANAVAGLLDRIALSHTEVSFKFIKDGKECLNTPGNNDIKSTIYSIFGKEFTSSLKQVDYEFNGVKVFGFISSPSSPRANRSMQYFFVNGRYVKSKVAMVAMEQAYKGNIMVGKFPACVLYINLAYEATDVNVHPAKLEIRFINERPIFDAIFYGVKNSLLYDNKKTVMSLCKANELSIENNNDSKVKIGNDTFNKESINIRRINNDTIINNKNNDFVVNKDLNLSNNAHIKSTNIDNVNVLIPHKLAYQKLRFSDVEDIKSTNDNHIVGSKNVLHSDDKANLIDYKKKNEVPLLNNKENKALENKEKKVINNKGNEIDFINTQEEILNVINSQGNIPSFVGHLFDTYVLLEKSNELILVDKHAAHERIIYEKLKNENMDSCSQELISPIKVTLDKNEYVAILENIDRLLESGFEVEDFGHGIVIVRAIPSYLGVNDVPLAISEIAGYILENRHNLNTEYFDWVYHNIACRAAIKAGEKDSKEELMALIDTLFKNPSFDHCPHGRPIYIIIKKSDIEKQFGRIV